MARTANRKAAVALDPEDKSDVLRRLKTIRGHVEGVAGMIDSDVYCIEVLKQLAALRSSLDRVGRIMLQHHLERCFLEDVRTGERREAIHELMNTLAYDKNFV